MTSTSYTYKLTCISIKLLVFYDVALAFAYKLSVKKSGHLSGVLIF